MPAFYLSLTGSKLSLNPNLGDGGLSSIPMLIQGLVCLASCLSGAQAGGDAPADPAAEPRLFEAVLAALEETLEDPEPLDALAQAYGERASRLRDRGEELALVHEFLGEIPSSHVALISSQAHAFFTRELAGEDSITPGLFLKEHAGELYVGEIMTGGPADLAGLAVGDRILGIDGLPPRESPRLDLRTDDAHLSDRATHLVLPGDDPDLVFEVARGDEVLELSLRCAAYSSLRGDRAASRVIEHRDQKLGYAKLSYMYSHDSSTLLRPLLEETFADCQGLLLDLRGRGGSQIAMWVLMRMLKGEKRLWDRPVVALVDRETRSAKEVLAQWLQTADVGQVVGELTAGAARPGHWTPVGGEYYLLCPGDPFAEPRGLELLGVTPDVPVDDPWPNRAGGDRILQRGLEVLRTSILESGKATSR